MKTLLQLIRANSERINRGSNDMQGSPIWNKTKQLIKLYYKENHISEISFSAASMLFQLDQENNRKMLIEINKDIFNK